MSYRNDKDYIRATVSVPSLLEGYGVQIRHGRCRGFCHGGRDYNMAVSEHICHCFVCNQSFDCFAVVMFFEGCDFMAAFEKLGGKRRETYAEHRAKQKKLQEVRQTQKKKHDKRFELYILIAVCDAAIAEYHQTVTAGKEPTEYQQTLAEYAFHNIERLKFEYENYPEER
jgi:hypothetical protein